MAADTFAFNNVNGQMVFFPNASQDALIVTQVSEYRHGVLIGTSMREMTFIVLNNCSNTPPVATLSDLSGIYKKGDVFTTCKNDSIVSFKIQGSDASSDTINITTKGIPTGATLNITNNNTPNPVISFLWNVATTVPGIYNFFVTLKNNHCPISSSQTIAYTIIVSLPYSISADILAPTQCLHKAYVRLSMANGLLPRIVTVIQGSKTIKTYTDYTGTIIDSFATGNYTAIVSSQDNFCSTSYNFSVPDAGPLPNPFTTPIAYCKYQTASPIVLSFVDSSTVQWYNENKQPITAAPVPSTAVPGQYIWYVTEQYKNCSVFYDSVPVIIYDLPHINISDTQTSICLGDKIFLQATGGVSYEWKSDSNEIFKDKEGNYYIIALKPATYTVKVTDEHNCIDSAKVSYDDVQQCCQFSYPNAFTPNGDGRNDRFRIVTYGNMQSFELIILDRWGQKVFTSTDPTLGWDGNFHGQLCEMGTYFYLLRAQCLTGHYEERKGDLTLIR